MIVWHNNGNKDREGIVRGNQKEGNWTYYNGDGSIDFKFDYGTGLERVRIAELEERDNTFYKIGKYKPYTGIVTESGGIKDYLLLGRFKSGKRDDRGVIFKEMALFKVVGNTSKIKKAINACKKS